MELGVCEVRWGEGGGLSKSMWIIVCNVEKWLEVG